MARYDNEPRPVRPEEQSSDKQSNCSHGGGGSSGTPVSGGNPWDKYRYQLGTPMIERLRHHHKRYGSCPGNGDTGTSSRNTGIGAIRKPGLPDWLHTVVFFEPEALMERGQRPAPLSFSRFSLCSELDSSGIRWSEDEKTGITSVFNIDEQMAQELGKEFAQRSFLLADFGEYRNSFHTKYEVNRDGSFRTLREHRANNIEPSDVLERLGALLMMRIPEIKKTEI